MNWNIPFINACCFFIMFVMFVEYYHRNIDFAVSDAEIIQEYPRVYLFHFTATICEHKQYILMTILFFSFVIPFTVFTLLHKYFSKKVKINTLEQPLLEKV